MGASTRGRLLFDLSTEIEAQFGNLGVSPFPPGGVEAPAMKRMRRFLKHGICVSMGSRGSAPGMSPTQAVRVSGWRSWMDSRGGYWLMGFISGLLFPVLFRRAFNFLDRL